MGVARIAVSGICTFSICFCSAWTQKFLMNNVDTYKKPVFMLLCQSSQVNDGNITSLTSEDTNQIRYKSRAQEVTFAKMSLEAIGAAAGGFIFGYAVISVSPVFDDFDTGWITFPVSIALGTALGATLVGNQLMDPNGSFAGSLAGSSLGTAVACPIAFIGLLAAGLSTLDHDGDNPPVFPLLVIAGALPVAGAVHGYNMKYMGCCGSPVQTEFDSDFHLRTNSSDISCKVQLFAVHF